MVFLLFAKAFLGCTLSVMGHHFLYLCPSYASSCLKNCFPLTALKSSPLEFGRNFLQDTGAVTGRISVLHGWNESKCVLVKRNPWDNPSNSLKDFDLIYPVSSVGPKISLGVLLSLSVMAFMASYCVNNKRMSG